MSGHLPCTATLSMSRNISTLNYLRSADTCLTRTDADSHLLVVRTCYNGQCKQMPPFRRSFQPKIAGAYPNLRSTVRSIFSVLPSGDHKHYFILRVNTCMMNNMISLMPIGYVRFTTSRRKSHGLSFQPTMSKKRMIVGWTNGWRCCAGWMQCIF